MATEMTCSQESRAAQEPLAGSFKPADTFFLIQTELPDQGGWAHGAVNRAGAAGAFRPLLAHLMNVPRAKILFIRRPATKGKNFYIAVTNQPTPKLYHAELDEYADLLALDLATVAPDTTPRINGRDMAACDELYTVCANGRHDPCCALHGTPVFQALSAIVGQERCWQTTHIGGHRLAATMIAFPQGIVYGRLDAVDADAVAQNHRAGYLLTHRYRGRGAYAGHALDGDAHQAANAAEGAIREDARLYADADLSLRAVITEGKDRWQVIFVDKDQRERQALVSMSMSEPRRTSCGDEPKPMPQHDIELAAT